MNPKGSVSFLCDRCSNLLSYSGTDIELEAFAGSERGMGPETGYRGDCTYNCPICENEILIEHEVWEYPVGAFNNSSTEVRGGTLVQGFDDLDFAFEEEIYSFDNETTLYLPQAKQIVTNLEAGVSSLLAEIAKDPSRIFSVKPREFEELIAHVFSREGFEVQLTKQTRDGGRDIIALKSELGIPIKYIIECKRWAADNPVSVEVVRALYGVQMQEGANKSVIATTSHFSPDAKKFATAQNTTEWSMSLKDHRDVMKWLRQCR